MSEQNIDDECLICKIDVNESDEEICKCPGCPYSYHEECLNLWESQILNTNTLLVCLMCRTEVRPMFGPEEPDPDPLNGGLSIINENSRALVTQAGLAPLEELRLVYTPDELEDMYMKLIHPLFPETPYDWATSEQYQELCEFRLGRSIIETGTYLRRDGDILRHLPDDLRGIFADLRDDPHVVHVVWVGEHSEQARKLEKELREMDPNRDRYTFNQENTLTVWRLITAEFIQTLRDRGSSILTPGFLRKLRYRYLDNPGDVGHELEEGLQIFQERLDRTTYFNIPWFVEIWKVEPQCKQVKSIFKDIHHMLPTWNPVDYVTLEEEWYRNSVAENRVQDLFYRQWRRRQGTDTSDDDSTDDGSDDDSSASDNDDDSPDDDDGDDDPIDGNVQNPGRNDE